MKLSIIQVVILVACYFTESKCSCNCHLGDWIAKENFCTVLYTGSGCNGEYWEIQPGEENPQMIKPDLLPRVFEFESTWTKAVSSVIVREGCELTLYTEKNLAGLNLTLSPKGTRFFDLYQFPQRKHIFYVPTWEKKTKSLTCSCSILQLEDAQNDLLTSCTTKDLKLREIFRCIGSLEEKHLCKFKYSVGTFANNRQLLENETQKYIKIGNETKPISEFYPADSEAIVYEVDAEIMVPINKTGIAKQEMSSCGRVEIRFNRITTENIDNY